VYFPQNILITMCGIAGIYRFQPSSGGDDLARVTSAVHIMRHRGPDRQRCTQTGPLTFGHARLSIIDLSAEADQPMTDFSGRYHLIFNGEIFNYQTLREDLITQGIQFTTSGDTEVLLHWLIVKGESGLHSLNGFFALAFYDAQKDELLLARDRFGEKPLWYAHHNDHFAFASEGKALHSLTNCGEIDADAVGTFLQYTYIPAPDTAFTKAKKVMPGECIRIAENRVHVNQWYSGADSDASTDLCHLMHDAVKMRLISDVPIGAFLSGGLDSSIVSAIAAQHTSRLRTFSVSFPEHAYLDEDAHARTVANHIGSDHTSIPLSTSDLFASFDDMMSALDEPFADASSLAMLSLCREVKRHVTVALSGDGADEFFAGYRKHLAHLRAAGLSAGMKRLIHAASPLIRLLPAGRENRLSDFARKFRRFEAGLSYTGKDRMLYWAAFSLPAHVRSVMSNVYTDLAARSLADAAYDQLQDILRADQSLVLPNDMLVKVDLMSMSQSLEVRAPFLDYRVAEFARRLHAGELVQHNQGKAVLREVFGPLLPAEILTRRKQGFEIPLEAWIRKELRDEVRSLHQSPQLRGTGFFRMDGLERTMAKATGAGDSSLTHLAFSLVVLNRWLERQS
jgi:asparagine synthase (glutamine-hydrolysing)